MIFITLGSQKFQFNRLLKKIDELVKERKLTQEIFAQIGYSDYIPMNYKYKDFLDRDEFQKNMMSADIVITHGGTGAIITALKNDKKVIAIPRLSKYGEHVDDHQIQIVEAFSKNNIIEAVYDIEEIENSIKGVDKKNFQKYNSNTHVILESIEKFINESFGENK